MAKKYKIRLLNKKSGEFLSSKFLKPRSSEKSIKPLENIAPPNKMKLFVKKLDAEIRNAAKTH